ncbi:MAG: hypothetical protein IJS29_06735 [Selenomonadaceae bacterium]|nr:hypothetical protein [Selenomonadaceae bacterium]
MARLNRRQKWLKAFINFIDGEITTCPNCGSHKLKDSYIELGEQRGWGAFWCEECRVAFWLSRVNLIDETLRQKIVNELPNDLKFI